MRNVFILSLLFTLLAGLLQAEDVHIFSKYLGMKREVLEFEFGIHNRAEKSDEDKMILQFKQYGYEVNLYFKNKGIFHCFSWNRVFGEDEMKEMNLSLNAEKNFLQQTDWKLEKDFVDNYGNQNYIYRRGSEQIELILFDNGFKMEMLIADEPLFEFLK